jgi:hypothetical protein
LVLGPHNVPVVTDTEEAASDIPLASISAITHGRNRKKIDPILKALGTALHSVDEETARIFAELTELGLGRTRAARTWSNMMAVDLSFYRSRTSQRLRAEGLAEGVIAVLTARKVFVSDDVRERVEACEDRDLLKAWLMRAYKVTDAEDIFGDLLDD